MSNEQVPFLLQLAQSILFFVLVTQQTPQSRERKPFFVAEREVGERNLGKSEERMSDPNDDRCNFDPHLGSSLNNVRKGVRGVGQKADTYN